MAAAQTLPALVGAVVGVQSGIALFRALSDDASAQVPGWQLGGTVLVTAVVASLPARVAVRGSVADSLRG